MQSNWQRPKFLIILAPSPHFLGSLFSFSTPSCPEGEVIVNILSRLCFMSPKLSTMATFFVVSRFVLVFNSAQSFFLVVSSCALIMFINCALPLVSRLSRFPGCADGKNINTNYVNLYIMITETQMITTGREGGENRLREVIHDLCIQLFHRQLGSSVLGLTWPSSSSGFQFPVAHN